LGQFHLNNTNYIITGILLSTNTQVLYSLTCIRNDLTADNISAG